MTCFADELGQAEEEGEDAGRKAAESDDQGDPAAVGVWALMGYASEDSQHQQDGDRSYEQDSGAGGKELAGVWLHKEKS